MKKGPNICSRLAVSRRAHGGTAPWLQLLLVCILCSLTSAAVSSYVGPGGSVGGVAASRLTFSTTHSGIGTLLVGAKNDGKPAGEEEEGPQSLTNAQKLALAGNTPLGTQVYVTDGFYISGSGSAVVNKFLAFENEGGEGRPDYIEVGESDIDAAIKSRWQDQGDGLRWYLYTGNEGNYYYSTDDVAYPWLVTTWVLGGSGANPLPTLTNPALQQLNIADPSDESHWGPVP